MPVSSAFNSIEEEKIAVEVGYNLLMRYDPTNEELYLDSKEAGYITVYLTDEANELSTADMVEQGDAVVVPQPEVLVDEAETYLLEYAV